MPKWTSLENLDRWLTHQINTLESNDDIPYDLKLGQVLAFSKTLTLVKQYLMEETIKKIKKSAK